MSKFIEIPLTEKMKNDYTECVEMLDIGSEKDCEECACNGGSLECLGYYRWRSDGE